MQGRLNAEEMCSGSMELQECILNGDKHFWWLPYKPWVSCGIGWLTDWLVVWMV